MTEMPARLGPRGSALWVSITESHDLAAAELEILTEACRCADRLEKLDEQLTGDDMSWLDLEKMRRDDTEYRVTVDAALSEARQQQNILKQLIASLRLPDEATGKKPQHRGARGAYTPKASPKGVSSLDRARAAKAGA
jgi:hypothetical protein